ncbi:MAG: hypothetical protein K0Q87_1468 [Neobacillus sp.]|nr:hypothetical protein [Neobacillus sp.]
MIIPMLMFFFIFLTACSSNSQSEDAKMISPEEAAMDSDSGESSRVKEDYSISNETEKKEQSETTSIEVPKQMVIYQAELHLRVKKFEQTLQSLEEKVGKYGGYIAESNVSKDGDEQLSGSIKIRIPQKHFQTFLHEAEGQAAEVLQRKISGDDVTEEYVDLESRLKSKRVVEERLISFMNSAEKTEDLLKISDDLSKVQEEIEMIEGRKKFLENQTSLSTVFITLYENKVSIPPLENDDLNTWEKTKKQFMKSTNMLLSGISGLVVFLLGNLPILIILAIIGILLFLYGRKVIKRNRNE